MQVTENVGKLTQRQSHVQEQMVELDKTINVTNSIAGDILNRLESVLVPDLRDAEKTGKDMPELVPLAHQIRELTYFLRRINDTLQSAYNRIEL